MIIEVGKNRIAFGLQWKPHLSGGDLHKQARAAKARYFWSAENAAYYGMLIEADTKKRIKPPIYAGAIALLHRYIDVPNLVVVFSVTEESAELPSGGFIVCGIHHGRPHSDFDKLVESRDEVIELLQAFKKLCGSESFDLYGDVRLSGINELSPVDVFGETDPTAALRKTKNAIVNPLAVAAVSSVVVGACIYGYNTYTDFQKAEAQRLAAASQKNAQQLYDEELALRRKEGVILARDIGDALGVVRATRLNVGGWAIEKMTCNVLAEKQMTCTLEYKLREGSKGTYETFVSASTDLENLEFINERIKGTRVVKALPFVEQGTAIEAAKPERAETIEFASALQRIRHIGEPKLKAFEPFAIPPGANVGELSVPPVTSAAWEFSGPMRSAKHLMLFPTYATVSQIVVAFSDTPRYEPKQSIAMLTVQGKIFSKPTLPVQQ